MSALTPRARNALQQYAEPEESMSQALERLFDEAGYEWREPGVETPIDLRAKYWAVFTALPEEGTVTLDEVCRMKNRGEIDLCDPYGHGRQWCRSMLSALERKGWIERVGEAEWAVTDDGWYVLEQADRIVRRPLAGQPSK